MWVLLLAGFLIPLVCFGYLLSKLDVFLAKNSVKIDNDKLLPTAIVLGETELAKQTAKLLEKKGIRVLPLNEPFLLEMGGSFCCLFALSDKDADNIVLCKVGKKVYDIEGIISVCNDRRDEGMFISENINYMLNETATAELLYQNVLQNLEVK
ncbi:MAG: hypothetical protein K0R84_1110 [Clostridia bacterium]|jgi:Trk K+ transport system NAD-binding subunit|nr:hypothetical protein [Clostridia bacterium]